MSDQQGIDNIPMEFERKFLLSAIPAEASAVPPVFIEQGWIPGRRLRERLRRITYPDGHVRLLRTVKLGRTTARIEIEEETSQPIFDAMWPLTREARIRKNRHVLDSGGYRWEIDVFREHDVILAEVELSEEGEEVELPSWLLPYVIREVTGDPTYINSRMAQADPESEANEHTPGTVP